MKHPTMHDCPPHVEDILPSTHSPLRMEYFTMSNATEDVNNCSHIYGELGSSSEGTQGGRNSSAI